MARLVKESGILGKAGDKLTAKNLNEKVSFDQMIEAIHKVQQNMGITGTTAKEAAGTIEGSTGSMHAAWENLLTGIADETQDIDELWNNFIQSAVASAKNMLPRIKKLVSNFSAFVDKKMREKFPDFMKDLDSAREGVKKLFKFIQDNGDEVLAVLKGIAVAFVTYKTVATIAGVVTAFKTLVTAIKAGELAMVALNGTLSVSPIGLVAAAVAGLTASLIALDQANKKAIQSQYGLNQAQQECIDKSEELYSEYQNMDNARTENNDAILSEYDYLKELKEEYNSLIDENGEVKKGYEARAEYILNELAEAMQVERKEIDKTIKKNGKLGKSLDDLMIKQKAQAILESNKQYYSDAMGERKGALEQYTQAVKTATEAETKFKSNLAANGLTQESFDAYQIAKQENDLKTLLQYQKTYSKETLDGLEVAWEAWSKASDGLLQAEKKYVGINQTIQNYEGLAASILEGDSKKIEKGINNLTNNVLTAQTGTEKTLQMQANEFREKFKTMKEAVEQGIISVTDAEYKESKTLMDNANRELIKYFKSTDLAKEIKAQGYVIPQYLTDGLKEGYLSVNEAMKYLEKLISFEQGDYGAGYAEIAQGLGIKIPERIAEGIMRGSLDVEQADKEMGELIQYTLNEAAAKSGIAAEDIPENIKIAVMEGEKDIETAVKEMKQGVVDGMADDDTEASNKGEELTENYADGISSKKKEAETAGKEVSEAAANALDTDEAETSGENFVAGFVNGIKNEEERGTVGKWASKIANQAITAIKEAQKEGSPSKITFKSGQNFTQGYINGIISLSGKLKSTVANLTKIALKQLKNGEIVNITFDFDETVSAVEAFVENLKDTQLEKYDNKIAKLEKQRDKANKKLEKQKEQEQKTVRKSYRSQIKSTEKYWDGLIDAEQKGQKSYEEQRDKELEALKLDRRNAVNSDSETKQSISDQMAQRKKYWNTLIKNEKSDKTKKKYEKQRDAEIESLKNQKNSVNSTQTRQAYDDQIEERKKYWDNLIEQSEEREKKYEKQREKEISKLEKESKREQKAIRKLYNKKIKESDNYYNKLIEQQKGEKENFEKASGAMLKEFTKAATEYSKKAKELIDSTIQGVTDAYQTQYDDLMNKQNELSSKMKNFGDLFEISGAGVITVNDLNEQTKQIEDYAKKLKKIKSKVSGELFDQIASYDLKEGQAFMDQLLGMSDEELQAYNDAYTEKMNIADDYAEKMYKKDFNKIYKSYKTAMKEALAGLPEQLEQLGEETMAGFLKGLTDDTKYMKKEVKKFIKGVVGEFKTGFKIKSPSRVMMQLGEFTGEGFAEGLKNMVGSVKIAASDIVNATSTSLDGIKTNLGGVKSVIGSSSNGLASSNSSVVNNYNLVQNNNSPKSLTALETYNARRQQIAMLKAATQNA